MSFLRSIFKTKARDWIFDKLEDSQTPNDTVSTDIPIDEYYIEFWLKSLRVVDIRKGLNKFHPVVHSFISIPYLGSKVPAEFNMVTKPGKLEELNAKNIDRVIAVNKLMLNKIPFRGGNIDLDVGLYSIKGQDLAGPYLTLVENISSKAGVSFVSQALQFAEPLKTGINLLTGGSDDSIFEIGLSTTFEGSILKTGYYVVIRAEKSQIDPTKLTIDSSDFKLLYEGNRVKDYPYLVFEIKKSKEKNDWWQESKLNEAYNALRDAYAMNRSNELESLFDQFKRTVRASSDLLTKDKNIIIKKIKTELMQNSLATSVDKSKEGELVKLEDLKIYGLQ